MILTFQRDFQFTCFVLKDILGKSQKSEKQNKTKQNKLKTPFDTRELYRGSERGGGVVHGTRELKSKIHGSRELKRLFTNRAQFSV